MWFSLYTNTRSKHNYWTSLSDHHCTILHKRFSCDWYGVGSMDVEPVFWVFRADLGPACVHHTQRGYTSSDKMLFLWNNQKQERMLWEAGANTRSVQGSQTGGYGFINTSVVALKNGNFGNGSAIYAFKARCFLPRIHVTKVTRTRGYTVNCTLLWRAVDRRVEISGLGNLDR